MAVKILRWGNSAGVRLSQPMLKCSGLTVGDYCEVRLLDSGEIRLRPSKGARTADDLPEPPRVTPLDTKW